MQGLVDLTMVRVQDLQSGQRWKKRKLSETAFGQDPQDGNPEEDASDIASEAAAPSNAFTAGMSATTSSLPVRFPPNSKRPTCGMCNTRADDPSPLTSAALDDAWSGLVPWHCYRKFDNVQFPFKKPKGGKCLICTNTYATAGLTAKHGSIVSYTKDVMAKGKQSEHADFLDMRNKWIKLHNDANEALTTKERPIRLHRGKRLKNEAVHELRSRRVEVVDTQKTSFKRPKKQFVEAHCWDEKQDGKYDASKEVEELVFGKTKKGVWKQVGRVGVWDASEKESKEVKDTRVEEEAVDEIGKHAAQIKSEKLAASFFAAAARRDSDAVQAPPLDFQELMTLVGFDSGAVQVKGRDETASGQEKEENETASGQESIDDADSDEAE